MQTDQPHNAPAPQRKSGPKLLALLANDRRARLALIAAGALAGFAVLVLIAVNLLISADWVRERVASRIKEQTGRELKVNGTTALLFVPGPRVIISDATVTDPEEKAGTADLKIGRLIIDLSLIELMSRQIDAERVVLERPMLTLRLGKHDRRAELPKPPRRKFTRADVAGGSEPRRRDIRLKDVRIEDGTIAIVYNDNGADRRVEHIAANLSLPTVTAPFTGTGKFDWKGETVEFSFALTSIADLREKRAARLELGLDTKAIAARFDGSLKTRPELSGQGQLSAKAHSIPSLLAWMREKPSASAALGDGELASRIEWKEGEITFSNARFALEHASGQGQAVVTLQSPRPHIRAALALDRLDLNPFFATAPGSASAKQKSQQDAVAQPESTPRNEVSPDTGDDANGVSRDWFTRPGEGQNPATASAPDAAQAPKGPEPGAAENAPAAAPASFDADVNLNVRSTRVVHLEFGPASLGLAFRDGILNATLGGMDLYDGHASGKLTIDAAKAVPSFAGDFRLDGINAKAILSDATQFSMLEGQAKLALQIGGAGRSSEEIKSSLQGQANLAVTDGAIEGINLTEMIRQIGEGQMPEMRQGPGSKTEFSDLGGSFTIMNGIAQTNNLQMNSPLLKVAASGNVDLARSTIDILANPEIVPGPEGQGGANDLAGLSVPVRIEGPLDRPNIRPELKAMFASPDKAGKTVNQIGKVLEKKFKGKPVGEAIGRILGNIQIGKGEGNKKEAEPQGNGPTRSGRKQSSPEVQIPEAEEGDSGETGETGDPDLDRILR